MLRNIEDAELQGEQLDYHINAAVDGTLESFMGGELPDLDDKQIHYLKSKAILLVERLEEIGMKDALHKNTIYENR